MDRFRDTPPVVKRDEQTWSRLGAFFRDLHLSPADVARRTRRIASLLRVEPLSAGHVRRLFRSTEGARTQTIRLLVAVARSLSGILVEAHDLFDLEPRLAAVARAAIAGDGHLPDSWRPRLSVFSPPSAVRLGRMPLTSDGEHRSAAETLEVMYREHAGLLRATARVRYRIPAEDIDALVNDVFASLLERRPRIHDARAFLLGAIGNSCRHYWRKRRHESPLLPEHEEASDPAAADRIEQWTRHSEVGAILARVGPKCRDIMRRHYLEGELGPILAKRLGTTPGYVKQLLHGCLKRAREVYSRLKEPRV
ncbi:MAG: sigma-70 family RNA polymerase sigma factor [Acidobacteria bacterium]|nr:sigma-70 family RNA polymerase sigma factor [Acidobacteriota bacterium]MBV9477531.1 sigma-70 family RNA polymerase sigma factor [Acidobacteriota bacterium]